jgi:hypothetical protein
MKGWCAREPVPRGWGSLPGSQRAKMRHRDGARQRPSTACDLPDLASMLKGLLWLLAGCVEGDDVAGLSRAYCLSGATMTTWLAFADLLS